MVLLSHEGVGRTVIDAVQELADGLAGTLQRSVAVDDAGLRLVVATAHFEEVDRARLTSLVGRQLDEPARDHVIESGALRWRSPTRLTANPEAGFDRARWCFPLWSRYELLGFMWLIDDDRITREEIEIATETARRIEEVLADRAESVAKTDAEIESVLRVLLSDDRAGRERAAQRLRDSGRFHDADHLAVLAVRNADARQGHQDRIVGAVRRGITAVMRGRLTESYACCMVDREFVLLVGLRAAPNETDLLSLATSLHAEIHRLAPTLSAAITVGVGSPIAGLVDVRDGLDQARVAAQVARDESRVATTWEGQPLRGLLRACLTTELPAALVPARIRVLEQQPDDNRELVAVFLRHAGNVNATADEMHLHRTSVYYRLAKFRQRTGLDLDDGETRLLLHLWLEIPDLVRTTR